MYEVAEPYSALPGGLTVDSITVGTALCLAREIASRMDQNGVLEQPVLSNVDSYRSVIEYVNLAMTPDVIVGSVGLLFINVFGSYTPETEFDIQMWLCARDVIERNIPRAADYADADAQSAQTALSTVVNSILLPVTLGMPLTHIAPLQPTRDETLHANMCALIAAATVFSFAKREGVDTITALDLLSAPLFQQSRY